MFFSQDWQWVTLKDIGTIITGSTPSKANQEFYGDDYPLFKPTDLESGYYTQDSRDKVSLLGFQQGREIPPKSTLVTCIGATIGKTGFTRTKGICNQQINAIIPDKKQVIEEFVYFYCISPLFQSQILSSYHSTTLPILKKSLFEKLLIPLPPLEIQREIVEILESKLEKIASAKALLESSLKKCETYRLSLLNDAFNGNLTPHSKDWQWVNIQSVCKKIIAGGDKPLSFSQEKTQTHNIPIYANAIKDNGLYGWTTESVIQEPAITISARGTIGFVCPRFEPFFPIVRLLVAIPNEKIDLLFLSYALKHILPNGNGSSIPQLTIPAFKQLSIPLPPLEIQREIVEILESKLEKIASAKAILESSLKKCETYRLSLLESAFEGELK